MTMGGPVKTPKSAAIVPPRRKSSLFKREKSTHNLLNLPACRHLIVTTRRGVFTWGSHGVKEIFHSGSGGIVAARKAKNGSSLLAVADSQVVILHDTRKGMQKSYRLRASDGQLRLLRYAGDSKSLFFTTTLQNAVQTYSLQDSKLLDPSYNHPSPPTVFAISSDFHLLLSASVFPPTIHLTNLLFNTPPILLRPQCSQSAVSTAAFHPERPNIFLLAFSDGACATYDAARLFRDGGKGERMLGPASSSIRAEMMSIKNLHAIINTGTDSVYEENQGHDAGTGAPAKYLGITAAAFVPGYRSRFVTVGQDGKCCVNDLAVPSKREARVIDSWHVRSPATSLSIMPFIHGKEVFGQKEIQETEDVRLAERGNALIAIGCMDSRVLLFDLRGNQLDSKTFHLDGTHVVDVEWMSGEDTRETKGSKSGHGTPQTLPVKRESKSVGSALGRSRSGTEEIIPIMDGADEMLLVSARDSSVRDSPAEELNGQQRLPATALNHMALFSPIKVLSETKATKRRISEERERDSEDSEETIKAISKLEPQLAGYVLTDTHTENFDDDDRLHHHHHHQPSIERALGPPIPQRPAREPMNNQITDAEYSRPARGLALFAPSMKPKIIAVPANPGSSKNKASTDRLNSQNLASPEETDEDLWTDVAPGPREPSRTAARKPSTTRRKSHSKSVAFHPPSSGPSEASNDTVIDWAPASSRLPNPILPLSPSKSHRRPSKKFKKGQISRSRSSTSNDTMVQWSSFKKRSGLGVHKDLSNSLGLSNIPPAQPLTEATHNPKVNSKSLVSQTKPPRLAVRPSVPAFLFSSPKLESEPATPTVRHNGGLQQTDNAHPPRTEEPSRPPPPPPQAEPFGSKTLSPSNDLFPSTLQRELQTLRADLKEDLAQQLAVQRSWFDGQLAVLRNERRALEEENRMLRGKLVVERRTKR